MGNVKWEMNSVAASLKIKGCRLTQFPIAHLKFLPDNFQFSGDTEQ